MNLPERKPNRLKNYDYSSNGVYFITICTKNKEPLFGRIVGATIGRPPEMHLSHYGIITKKAIENINKHYPCISAEKYVIMPNHLHLLLSIDNFDENGRPMVAPTISTVIQQMKGFVSKQIGFSPWQKLFHDHIIRNEKDYEKIWEYIDTNPLKWESDCFYTKNHQTLKENHYAIHKSDM